jgi:hypothetical protein
MNPLAIDLFCGLGGWTEGLLAEGYYVVGFDIERHDYGTGGYPAQLVLQSVLTLHGSQFKDAALIVASPPCQEFSYMAMPWSRAKAKERDLLEGRDDPKRLTALFDACFRIQREAIESAGHFIPLVVENVRGAQKWVGRSRWNYGSFHLWGDVPALMPIAKAMKNVTGGSWFGLNPDGSPGALNNARDGIKLPGNNSPRKWADRDIQRLCDAGNNGTKLRDIDGYERTHPNALGWKIPRTSSNSKTRKAASAQIAKIPFPLAQYIARIYKPT